MGKPKAKTYSTASPSEWLTSSAGILRINLKGVEGIIRNQSVVVAITPWSGPTSWTTLMQRVGVAILATVHMPLLGSTDGCVEHVRLTFAACFAVFRMQLVPCSCTKHYMRIELVRSR